MGREELRWRRRDIPYRQLFLMEGRELDNSLLTYPFKCVTSTRSRSLLATLQTILKEAGIELKKITTTLCETNERDFTSALDVCHMVFLPQGKNN
jgi:hypothetical protein